MSHVGRKHGAGAEAAIASCRALLGEHAARRAAEIAALPTVNWKGRRLYTIRCHGTSGQGPHDCNVPLALVWALIDLRRYVCMYHAGDVWG